MKVGIITVCDNDINYGAFLQMYALKEYLEEIGHTVYIIQPPINENGFKRTFYEYKKQYNLKKNYLLLRKVWRLFRLAEKKIRLIFEERKYNNFCVNHHLHFLSIEDAQKECEIVILGSDEIWNIRNSSVASPFYFGKDFIGKRIFSYAVSAGDSTEKEFGGRKDVNYFLENMEDISVRDSNTRHIIENIVEKKCDVVCDPTILIETDRLMTENFTRKKPYLLLYVWDINECEISNLKRFAEENDLEIVCTMGGRNYSFADESVNISPLAFGKAIQNAKYVYASTFHGCIFSILNKKRAVYCCKNKKVYDLLKRYDQLERIFTDEMSYEMFCNMMKSAQDVEKLDKLILQQREYGRKWLKERIRTKSCSENNLYF